MSRPTNLHICSFTLAKAYDKQSMSFGEFKLFVFLLKISILYYFCQENIDVLLQINTQE